MAIPAENCPFGHLRPSPPRRRRPLPRLCLVHRCDWYVHRRSRLCRIRDTSLAVLQGRLELERSLLVADNRPCPSGPRNQNYLEVRRVIRSGAPVKTPGLDFDLMDLCADSVVSHLQHWKEANLHNQQHCSAPGSWIAQAVELHHGSLYKPLSHYLSDRIVWYDPDRTSKQQCRIPWWAWLEPATWLSLLHRSPSVNLVHRSCVPSQNPSLPASSVCCRSFLRSFPDSRQSSSSWLSDSPMSASLRRSPHRKRLSRWSRLKRSILPTVNEAQRRECLPRKPTR